MAILLKSAEFSIASQYVHSVALQCRPECVRGSKVVAYKDRVMRICSVIPIDNKVSPFRHGKLQPLLLHTLIFQIMLHANQFLSPAVELNDSFDDATPKGDRRYDFPIAKGELVIQGFEYDLTLFLVEVCFSHVCTETFLVLQTNLCSRTSMSCSAWRT